MSGGQHMALSFGGPVGVKVLGRRPLASRSRTSDLAHMETCHDLHHIRDPVPRPCDRRARRRCSPVLDMVLRRTGHADLAGDLRRLRWPVWALSGVLLLRIAVDAVPRAEAWSGPFFTAALIAGGAGW